MPSLVANNGIKNTGYISNYNNVSQPAAKSSASTAQIDRGKIEDLSLGPNGTINRAVESKKN